MKLTKRITAMSLAILLCITTGLSDVSAAAMTAGQTVVEDTEAIMPVEETETVLSADTLPEDTESVEMQQDTETVESPVVTENAEDTEGILTTEDTESISEPVLAEPETETTDVTAEPEDTESVVMTEDTEVIQDTEAETETESETESDEIQEETTDALVNYLVVDKPQVDTPDTQKIMLGIGDGTQKIDDVILSYSRIEDGSIYQMKATEILDDFVLFSKEFKDDSLAGTYKLQSVAYTADGINVTSDFAEMGIDASFGINKTVETTPDDVLLTDDQLEALSANVEANVVTVSENAKTEELTDALEDAGCEPVQIQQNTLRKGTSADVKGMSSLVVVLDAGHGGTDGGAQGNGLSEKVCNLKIAQYCKAELEEYSGVKVIMTRSDDTYLTLAQRAQVAIDNKADVFISLHINSSTSAAPSGANVYYPNANYNKKCHTTGKSLASVIESKLTGLGLASGGIHIRDSENATKYADGSLADYYGVIKRCKENSIPALIVEHAFISNASDAKNYLTSDAQLKKLGVADATGIAEYYGLSKGVGFNSIVASGSDSLKLTWTMGDKGITGYEIYRSVSANDGFEKVATINSRDITSWTDTGLETGKTYYYKIRTYTQSGSKVKYGSYSAVASGGTIATTSIKSIKSESSKKLKVSWNIIESATGYELSRSTSENGTYKQIAMINSGTQSSYVDSTVKAGKLYYYKIRSIGQEKTETTYSDYSIPVSGRTAKLPKDVKVVSRDESTLRIYWEPVENVAGYTIRRAESANGKYKKIVDLTDPKLKYYDDTTVSKDKKYYYKIQAFNYNGTKKGYSGYTKPCSGKVLAGTSITKVESTSSSKQTIYWKKVNDADGYVIYQSTSKNGTYKKIKTIKSKKTTSYKVTDLTAGTKYYYKVRTRKKVDGVTGYGKYSTPRGARVGTKVKIASVTGTAANKIKITWGAVKGASSYEIYRATSSKGSYKKIGSVKSDKLSYTDKKLKMTKKYYYKVEAKLKGYKSVGTSGKSKAVSGYPIRKTQISSITANEDQSLVISWVRIKGVTGYEIYRSTQINGTYTRLATVSGYETATYKDTTAEDATVYYYKVRPVATYEKKTIYGKYSDPMEGCNLLAPTHLTVVGVSETQIDLSWNRATGASGYIIYRSTSPDSGFAEIARVSDVTTYSDTSVATNVVYYYKLKSMNSSQQTSTDSSIASGCAAAKLSVTGAAWRADQSAVDVTWTKSTANVNGYEIYRSSSENVKTIEKVASVTDTFFADTTVKQGVTYYYRVRSYTNTSNKPIYSGYSEMFSTNPSDYRIMGSSAVTVAQMTAMYQASGKTYPASVYASKGAPDIQTFCQIVYDECVIEGVKPEVLFAQICHETAYLQFGGQVKVEQCNFGGLGALDNGASGGTFADVRTGVRTQVQHLKAYASVDDLRQACIDDRFRYITRGKAAYVQQLGNGNWATDASYAFKLMSYVNKMRTI